MKRIFSSFAALTMALALSGAIVASPILDSTAQADQSQGKLHKFTFDTDTKTGRVVLDTKNGLKRFRVTKNTDCGESFGEYGDTVPCRNLRQDKYHNRSTYVSWSRSNGVRKASYVSVDQS